MSRKHKVQVTLNEVEYAAVLRRAEEEGLKHAAVVREAIQEYCVKPDRRRRQLEALAAIDALPPAPVPSSWADWKREYSRLKVKSLPTDPPDLRDPVGPELRPLPESDEDR